jgi:hypothetical protein
MASPDPEVSPTLVAELRGIGHRWPQRAKEAWVLAGCAEFSDDARLQNPLWIVREVKRHPEIFLPLAEATTDPETWRKRQGLRKRKAGRDRLPGWWCLVLLAFLMSRDADIEHWYGANVESHDLWRECGFDQVPSKNTVYERFDELIDYAEAFNEATGKLWRLATSRDSRVGRHWHFDGTPYETHVRLQHDPNCPTCIDDADAGRKPRPPEFLEREPIGVVKERRKAAHELPPEEERHEREVPTEIALPLDDLEDLVVAAMPSKIDRLHPDYYSTVQQAAREAGMARHVFIKKDVDGRPHRYVSRDWDTGFKIYSAPSGKKLKQWSGGMALRATDDYLGIAFATVHLPASESEPMHYPAILLRSARTLGTLPEAVCGDRGNSIRANKKLNALCGVGDAFPYRAPNGNMKSRASLRKPGSHDEYGFASCRFCGGPGTFKGLGFRLKRGTPILEYRCANPITPDCGTRKQQKRCEEEWLLFGALTREDPLRFSLRADAMNKENAHAHSRSRYAVAGNSVYNRAKKLGIPWLDLRASAAQFLDIFRVCLRQGWIDSDAKRNTTPPMPRQEGNLAVERLLKERRDRGLLYPAGPQAEKLGLVWDGELPEGYVPIAERRKLAAEARKAASRKAAATQKANAKKKVKPPPKAAAA